MICQNLRSSEALTSFVAYCEANPTQRFWQALRNWSDSPFVFVGAETPSLSSPERVCKTLRDTYYWEGRDK